MNTMFFHPHVQTGKKNKRKTRRATVAAVVTPTNDGITVRFGISICSEKDVFVKKYGRAAAEGIAISRHPVAVVMPNPGEYEKLTEYFIGQATRLLAGMGYEVLPKKKKESVVNGVAVQG